MDEDVTFVDSALRSPLPWILDEWDALLARKMFLMDLTDVPRIKEKES